MCWQLRLRLAYDVIAADTTAFIASFKNDLAVTHSNHFQLILVFISHFQ